MKVIHSIRELAGLFPPTLLWDCVFAGLAVGVTTLVMAELGAHPSLAPLYAVPVVGLILTRGVPAGMIAGVFAVTSFELYLVPAWGTHSEPAAVVAGAIGFGAFVFGLILALKAERQIADAADAAKRSYTHETTRGALDAHRICNDIAFTGAGYLMVLELEKIVRAGRWGAPEIGFASEIGRRFAVQNSVANDNALNGHREGCVVDAKHGIRACAIGDEQRGGDELAQH